ncbi:MAG: shikimate kinase AroK [Gammaproteobacteria bacterium]
MTTEPTDNIFLIGLMGAGKTTIGRRLAEVLKLRFLDVDHEIERRTGATVALIFDVEGEPGFRAREARLIDELTRDTGQVLATGGGAVIDPQNRRHLAERGFVVYLQASVDLLHARTRGDKRRPLLQTGDPRARLAALLEQREPMYLACADLIVNTSRRTVRQLVEHIRAERQRLCQR